MSEATKLEHAPLEAVYIYFDTATYDEIQRDVKVSLNLVSISIEVYVTFNSKVTLEAQLGLIGGTMGLLTGFSILSAFEVIFFLLKLVLLSIRKY